MRQEGVSQTFHTILASLALQHMNCCARFGTRDTSCLITGLSVLQRAAFHAEPAGVTPGGQRRTNSAHATRLSAASRGKLTTRRYLKALG